ncbi:MAG: UDP-N-acetylmuramoyl-L-alanyl-D-glutamate--2,6-diaminopimelate ligase [Nitrospiria bacterium]
MKLKNLITDIPVKKIDGSDEISVSGLAYSSKEVDKGYLFGAMQGIKTDGHRFIKEALERGASVILCEEKPSDLKEGKSKVTYLQVENSRRSFAQVACRFYGDPSTFMGIIGVTGTNGKTTTTFLVRKLMERKGPVGLIGTVGNWVGNSKLDAVRTTPESSDLQSLFNRMKIAGVNNVVMEVSSHALAMERVSGTSFDTAIFTNLTQDHLEYHQSMENYFLAKSKLFTDFYPMGSKKRRPVALINMDDPWGVKLKKQSVREVLTYGLSPESDLQGTDIQMSRTGTSFRIKTPFGTLNIHSPMLGIFNVYNQIAAAGAALHHSVPLNLIEETLSQSIQVPGRLEKVPGQYPITVLVDYAHTEDALLNVLKTIQEIKEGKILLVFGCGGDRDKGKRAKMGSVAGRFADHLFLTSDNPRSEDPHLILKEIEDGVVMSGSKRYRILVNRREAIEAAIEKAKPGDLVLIAGKGHEDYQIIGNSRFPFNDLEAAKEVLTSKYGF